MNQRAEGRTSGKKLRMKDPLPQDQIQDVHVYSNTYC